MLSYQKKKKEQEFAFQKVSNCALNYVCFWNYAKNVELFANKILIPCRNRTMQIFTLSYHFINLGDYIYYFCTCVQCLYFYQRFSSCEFNRNKSFPCVYNFLCDVYAKHVLVCSFKCTVLTLLQHALSGTFRNVLQICQQFYMQVTHSPLFKGSHCVNICRYMCTQNKSYFKL